nr:SH3 domain-containing protein [uncultured Duganella sp.]
MEAIKLHAVAAFAAGLIVTLFLAAYLTPRAWWRRPNARALFIMVAGAWGFGSLILYAVQGTPAVAAEPRHTSAAQQPFRVHRDLNLRAAPGVQAGRVAVVPAGAEVTPTGARDGDWWQIKTVVNGDENTGWVSSLWLRRSGE